SEFPRRSVQRKGGDLEKPLAGTHGSARSMTRPSPLNIGQHSLAQAVSAHYYCAYREAPMMSQRQVRKRAVNLFVDTELLDEARRLGINVSEILEHRLRSIVRAEQEKRWLEENREAIASINSLIDRHG